ncbi:hypothetical protein E0Z10_g703 [Xylaria hypoxylon]|uniref:C2H2 type master regulator of conidiophore development brlA n=1 Tax=Xylaria hypoxylon TaxID=37992 RepID=A0A4Z0ZEJ4_9PEZI|nr:hypothetical protein E0Z10_g703 [Xylaria hypoxylon]
MKLRLVPMIPTMIISRAAIAPRSHGLPPGAIAGTVIGSVLGGSILLVVLGFLYFRYRRKARIAQAEEALHESNTAPWPGLPLQQTGLKDDKPDGTVPVLPKDPTTQRSPTSPYGEDWMRNNQVYTGYDTLPQDMDFSLPRQQTFPITAEQTLTTPLNHASTAPEAANTSYYDTRISMDSDPVQTITPPSTHMSEMYKAQLREAEERRRSSSMQRRIWNTITRQSTRNSKGTVGDGAQSPSLQQQFVNSSIAPESIKQEPGQESPGGIQWQGITPNYVEEPEQIAEGAPDFDFHRQGSGPIGEQRPQSQYGRYERPAQDSQYAGFPSRIDSTVRETTERNLTLPSSVLTAGPTYGLPPGPQPRSSIEQRERLKSPEIPEPMNVDGPQPETNGHSPFRSSHSPQLSPPDSFTINPMAILHPTNPAEQAAYTTYQIKHSASPPVMPPPAPEIVTLQPTQERVVDPPPPKGDDFADMYLDLPSDDEYRRSIDSYEYPSTPGQSSIAESSGRTPDTRPTVSPSPFPTIPEHGKLKPDPNFSPNSSKLSPLSGPLVCPECSREFDQIHKLNHHKRYHDRTHECTYEGCERKFGTKTHLDRHINDRHLKLRAYHCTEPTCGWFKGGKSFPRKDNWRRHMIKKHGSTAQDFDRMELSL